MSNEKNYAKSFKPIQVSGDVLDKELFVEAIGLIQSRMEKVQKFDEAFDQAIHILCIGNLYVDVDNEYLDAALLLLECGMHDRTKIIRWWLFDGQHGTVSYQMNGEQVKRALDTAENLYEYLMDDYNYQVADTAEVEEFNKISVKGDFLAENEDDVPLFG